MMPGHGAYQISFMKKKKKKKRYEKNIRDFIAKGF